MKNENSKSGTRGSRSRLRGLLALHRTLGIVSALFVLVLSVTGLLLQHTSLFRMDVNFLRGDGWLSWYRMQIPEITVSFSSDFHTASLIGNSLYFDTVAIASDVEALVGLVDLELMTVAATSSRLLLLDSQQGIIEILDSVHGVPGSIEALGSGPDSSLMIRTPVEIIRADLDRLVFDSVAGVDDALQPAVSWSNLTQLPVSATIAIKEDFGDSLISWERLFLDIHSGRFLGGWGVILVDIMAVIFMIMAVSGVWIWSKRRSRS